jgi:transposase
MPLINAAPPSECLIADKSYDSNALHSWLIDPGTTPTIRSKTNRTIQKRKHRPQNYRQRNVVERVILRVRDWRRVATLRPRHHEDLHSHNRHRRSRHLVAPIIPDISKSRVGYRAFHSFPKSGPVIPPAGRSWQCLPYAAIVLP